MKLRTIYGILIFLAGISLGLWAGVGMIEEKLVIEKVSSKEQTLGVESYLAHGDCEEPASGCGNDYYWDYDTCSCEPYEDSSCEEPADGCGMNHYWDSYDCQCKPESSSCEEPTEGCGMNHYWDYNSCSCVYSGECSEPTEGCGTDYYWDVDSCSCVYSGGTCEEPAGGCGNDYYWDSTTCSCEYSGSSGCDEPTSGCGEGFYWDYYSCSCKSDSSCNPPSTGCGTNRYWDSYSCTCKESCHEPSGGCGYGYYWDWGSCSCKSVASCSPPAAGCGTNYYWDSYYCSCKPYQGVVGESSCSPPAAGCGTNYYWDSYSCNCKQYPNYYDCSEPEGGCGRGWYWDGPICSCKSLHDEDIYYLASYSSPYSGQEEFDRLAYEPLQRISCIQAILTPTEYERLRYMIPTTDVERQEIKKLGEKVVSCWEEKSEEYTAVVEGETCLVNALGESAYRQIYKGERDPTYEEHLIFEACFGKPTPDSVNYLTDEQVLPEPIDECLRNLFADDYESVKSGEIEVAYELRDKVDRCFGIDPQPFEEGRSYHLPDEVEDCLRNAVSEQRFDEINWQGSEPTEAEKIKADFCFGRLNNDQAKFLPLPTEQVPYLTEAPELINFGTFKQETREVEGEIIGDKVIFSGTALPNSVVTIYIYSEPIVVTTKTDENGDWVYELNQPLTGEKHIAYATVKSETGQIVRSSVFDFSVIAAPDIGQQFLRESETAGAVPKFIIYAVALISLGVAVVMGGVGYLYFRKVRLEKARIEGQLLTGERKSKGKNTPGSVN